MTYVHFGECKLHSPFLNPDTTSRWHLLPPRGGRRLRVHKLRVALNSPLFDTPPSPTITRFNMPNVWLFGQTRTLSFLKSVTYYVYDPLLYWGQGLAVSPGRRITL